MSSQSYSYSSSSYSSTINGQTTSQSQTMHSTPSGTTIRTTYSAPGQPNYDETKSYPGGREIGSGGASSGQGRIEDVTDQPDEEKKDAEEGYEEKMEDEYAKREGGA